MHFKEKLLGIGSHGTTVYKGKFNDRDVAIKKVQKFQVNKVMKEISIIQKNDHPNILWYFGTEEDELHYYIATERCECNMKTFIEDPTLRNKLTSKMMFQQLAEGLNYLHVKQISN